MNRKLLFFILILFSDITESDVQPPDLALKTIGIINKKIDDVNDPLQSITRNLSFSIDSSDPMPGASSNRVGGVLNITFTSSMLDVIFYTAELSVLAHEDVHWLPCQKAYSSYLRSTYRDMMLRRHNHTPISPLTPLEKYGSVCSGIEAKYPFNGKNKIYRDRQAQDSIGFIYLHELSHLHYGHINYHIDGQNSEEIREANCAMRKQEKEADLLAAHKLVKFGWYNSALDVSVWGVMLNLGVMETSRNSTLDHPSVIERMTYVLAEVRDIIANSGGQITQELSNAIDESKELEKKQMK